MRFMMLIRVSNDANAAPGDRLLAALAHYHGELAKAGVLLDANGLQPAANGALIRYAGGKRTVVDEPSTPSHALVAGYTIVETKTPAEAIEWAKRMPAPEGAGPECEIEVRQMLELEDFAAAAL